MPDTDVLIIGAGLAGLNCARVLHEKGVGFHLLDASEDVGGRVRTDRHEGFLLDRGFQVLLSAYPEAHLALDYDRLDLRPFYSGADTFFEGRFHRIADPFRHPGTLPGALLDDVGTLADKLRVLRVRTALTRGPLSAIFERPALATGRALRERWGFSEKMVERFLRPFLGGILLDNELQTSSRMFEFVFRMFSMGKTVVPALGIGELPRQIAGALPSDSISLHTRVASLSDQHVVLEGGEALDARAIVVATDGPTASKLLKQVNPPEARSVTCLYYASEVAPSRDPILMLDGEGRGPVNNLAVMSNVSPSYAPPGASLMSATVLGTPRHSNRELDASVREHLDLWFGASVSDWELLRIYRVSYAQPAQPPGTFSSAARPARVRKNLFVAGDYLTNASINGALESGRLTAEAILQEL